MKDKILKFLSAFTSKPLKLSDGISVNDSFSLKKPLSTERIEKAQRKTKLVYEFRNNDEVGRWEFVGMIRKRDINIYRLKHTQTGEVIDFTKSAFELIFQRKRN